MKVDVDKLSGKVEPVLARMGFELWDLEYARGPGGSTLRVTIDAVGGVTLDDCTRVTRALSPALDVADAIHEPYRLEVSSPGFERVLRREEHFRRVTGERAHVQLRGPLDGRRNLEGRILGADDGRVALDVDGEPIEVPLGEIRRARLVHDWPVPPASPARGRWSKKR